MRVLVIGSGSIGRRHHDNLEKLGAQSRLLSWREAGPGGAVAAMDDVGAVVIATATNVRLPLIEAATARSLPIYIEKPLAFRPAEVEAIAALAAPVGGIGGAVAAARWRQSRRPHSGPSAAAAAPLVPAPPLRSRRPGRRPPAAALS